MGYDTLYLYVSTRKLDLKKYSSYRFALPNCECNICLLSSVCAGCPADFTYIASVNGCYKVVESPYENWYDAGRKCQEIHNSAHLLVINGAQEHHVAVSGQFLYLVSIFSRPYLSNGRDIGMSCRPSVCLSVRLSVYCG